MYRGLLCRFRRREEKENEEEALEHKKSACATTFGGWMVVCGLGLNLHTMRNKVREIMICGARTTTTSANDTQQQMGK